MTESADGFFLDLTNAFTGKIELLANLLECHLRLVDAEERLDDVSFTLIEC